MPAVSVIVPNYNHARYLEQRIGSILAQTWQDFEVLLLDDASTDESEAVIASFERHPTIHVHRNEVNSGSTFVQWNRGVELATGEFVWFAESDDAAAPRFLETMIEAFRRNPDASLAYCDSELIDPKGRSIGRTRDWNRELDSERWDRSFRNSGKDEAGRYLSLKNTIPNASAVLFRKSDFERVSGANAAMKFCGDWLLWVELLLLGDIEYEAQPLNRFRVAHTSSVRGSRVAEQRFLEERCSVLGRLFERGAVPDEVVESVVSRCASEWIDEVDRVDGVPAEELFAILEQLEKVVPGITRRIVLEAVMTGQEDRQKRRHPGWRNSLRDLVLPRHSRRFRVVKSFLETARAALHRCGLRKERDQKD